MRFGGSLVTTRKRICVMDVRELKDVHKGQRCFIIGTGPSLNYTRFDLIKDEILFGVNGLYDGLHTFGIACRYYGVADDAVLRIPKMRNAIFGLMTTLFLSTSACNYYRDNTRLFRRYNLDPILLPRLPEELSAAGSSFSEDISKGTYWGQTVIFDVCLQVAYYMGFDKVYLLGCDCDYDSASSFNGDTSVNPKQGGAAGDWSRVFRAYETAKKVYEAAGKEIVNSTVGGNLEIFRRESLEELREGGL